MPREEREDVLRSHEIGVRRTEELRLKHHPARPGVAVALPDAREHLLAAGGVYALAAGDGLQLQDVLGWRHRLIYPPEEVHGELVRREIILAAALERNERIFAPLDDEHRHARARLALGDIERVRHHRRRRELVVELAHDGGHHLRAVGEPHRVDPAGIYLRPLQGRRGGRCPSLDRLLPGL